MCRLGARLSGVQRCLPLRVMGWFCVVVCGYGQEYVLPQSEFQEICMPERQWGQCSVEMAGFKSQPKVEYFMTRDFKLFSWNNQLQIASIISREEGSESWVSSKARF